MINLILFGIILVSVFHIKGLKGDVKTMLFALVVAVSSLIGFINSAVEVLL